MNWEMFIIGIIWTIFYVLGLLSVRDDEFTSIFTVIMFIGCLLFGLFLIIASFFC